MRVKFTAIIHDHGARIFRMIGVADIDRDVFLPDGKNRVVMQDIGSHIAHLPQF